MATKAKKSTKKSGAKGAAAANGKPRIISAKGGMKQPEFLNSVLSTMDVDNWLTKAQARDFVASLKAVVADEIAKGNAVNLFGIVKIVPRLHTSGVREVHEVFGDSTSPMVKKKAKAKVSFAAGQGIFGKFVKDAKPSTQKLAKKLGA